MTLPLRAARVKRLKIPDADRELASSRGAGRSVSVSGNHPRPGESQPYAAAVPLPRWLFRTRRERLDAGREE
jgi:hypothetical protein